MTYKFIEDFIHELSELGVKKGDALLIHSDLFAFVVAACWFIHKIIEVEVAQEIKKSLEEHHIG